MPCMGVACMFACGAVPLKDRELNESIDCCIDDIDCIGCVMLATGGCMGTAGGANCGGGMPGGCPPPFMEANSLQICKSSLPHSATLDLPIPLMQNNSPSVTGTTSTMASRALFDKMWRGFRPDPRAV